MKRVIGEYDRLNPEKRSPIHTDDLAAAIIELRGIIKKQSSGQVTEIIDEAPEIQNAEAQNANPPRDPTPTKSTAVESNDLTPPATRRGDIVRGEDPPEAIPDTTPRREGGMRVSCFQFILLINFIRYI